MRMLRIPLIIEILRNQPLPAEIIIPRLQQRLVDLGLPMVEERRIKADLAWILDFLGTNVIERVARSELNPEPPAEFRRHRVFYRINGAEDLIAVSGQLLFLTELEALALVTARAQLSIPPAPGVAAATADVGPLAGAIDRLLLRLGFTAKDKRIPDILAVTQAAPQQYNPLYALEVLRAIRCGQGLELDYQPNDKAAHAAVVQPSRVVLVDGEPFLWAWDRAAQVVKRYKLARIRSLKRLDAITTAPADLHTQVRQQLIGAFKGTVNEKQRGRVVVRVTAQGVPHLRERQLGKSQTWEDLPDGGARVAFNTSGLDAVKHWFLQFGGTVTVEQPASLVDGMRAEVTRMMANYTEGKSVSV